jgi:tetratricopeptide (TPR) repeat protein
MDQEHLQVFAEFLSALSKANAGQEKQAIQDLTQLAVRTHMWGHIHAEVLRIRARLYYQSGFIFLALVDLQNCLRFGKFYRRERGELLLLLANCCAELRRPKLVARILRQACTLGSISARSALKTLHNFGVRCNLRGEAQLGFKYFCLVVQNEGTASNWIFCNALINRGCWLGHEGHYGLAEDDFLRAIAKNDIEPKLLVRAWFNLGNLYWLTGKYSRAIECFAKVLEASVTVDDLRPLSRCKMAHSYERLGQHDAALIVLREGDHGARVRSAENRETVSLYSGFVLLGCKQFEKAEKHFVDVFSRPGAESVIRARSRWAYGFVRCLQEDYVSGIAKMHEARGFLEGAGEKNLLKLIENDIQRFETQTG